MKKSTAIFVGLLAIAFAAAGCGSKSEQPAGDETKTAKADTASTPAEPKKEPEVKPAMPEPVMTPPVKLSASHILLMHTESMRKPPEITRTKADAKKLADEIMVKLKAGGDFAALAKQHSDCPSKEQGGDLGTFMSNRMIPEFSAATQKLQEGEIAPAPVETSFGFHIIKRQKVQEVHARHVLVMHKESKRVPPEITRTKVEAKKRIDEVAAKLKKGGDFAKLAAEYSDCPSKAKGGDLGAFGKGMMAPPFEAAAFALKDDEISSVVETDFGYHIIQRLPLEAPPAPAPAPAPAP